jgi:hypothetical protein
MPKWPTIQVAWKAPKETGYPLHECPICCALVYGQAAQDVHEAWHIGRGER